MTETATERLLYECVHVLAILAERDKRWRNSHFSRAMDRVAKELGYRDTYGFYAKYLEPDPAYGSGPFP